MRIGDQQQAAEGVIECDQRVGQQEDRIGQGRVRFELEPRLEEADDVVAEIADQPA